jgi:hypothetical protein
MCGPPDPEMRSPAAANGRAKSQSLKPQYSSDTAENFQARKLRRRFSLCQATACTVANLAWGIAR